MPGPKSAPNPDYKREAAKPNRKSAARLATRVAGYAATMADKSLRNPGGFNRPGSQK